MVLPAFLSALDIGGGVWYPYCNGGDTSAVQQYRKQKGR